MTQVSEERIIKLAYKLIEAWAEGGDAKAHRGIIQEFINACLAHNEDRFIEAIRRGLQRSEKHDAAPK